MNTNTNHEYKDKPWIQIQTLFFPLLRISRQRVSCSSVSSCLLSKSLNWNITNLKVNKYKTYIYTNMNIQKTLSLYQESLLRNLNSPRPLASWWSQRRVWEGLAPVPRRINTIPRWKDMQILSGHFTVMNHEQDHHLLPQHHRNQNIMQY